MTIPTLEQFRIETVAQGLIHLVFDMPDRSMNVFSNAAIHELGAFAAWLAKSDVRGVVIRSGKTSGFCAGADLGELGVAYDMIMAAPAPARSQVAFDHFFPLSAALRALETSGKPVASAIAGLALGGGCELALGTHYRVLADTPKAAMGLPESLVGLLPGGGGTQRLPRLIGIDRAFPILLEGGRLAGQGAVDAGLANEVVPLGEEVAAAERWLLSSAATSVQPWDRPGHSPASPEEVRHRVSVRRGQALRETLGHEPAPLAILDCIAHGLPEAFDKAIRTEMRIFSDLIKRREPRNMIQTLFVGKLDYERAKKTGAIPETMSAAVADLLAASKVALAANVAALAAAGFRAEGAVPDPVRDRAGEGYWLDDGAADGRRAAARAALAPLVAAASAWAVKLSPAERRAVDYAVVSQGGFPAYLGGPIAFAETR